ncbi:unnamed protein product [Calicophoron daubneyi]|uniref:G-protein coupled receptors family 1 profile domain-containing protein n=1 Tax=Calicophoron daubneyi TaxID=300641 RepID=A0AAV2TMG9_CALDB
MDGGEAISKTMFDSVEGKRDYFHCLVASLFFGIGLLGICLHGRNLSRLPKLDRVLPPGVVNLHFHLALANLGILAMFPFGGISALFNRWLFGELGCQIYAFEGMVCGLTSIFLTCILPLLQFAVVRFGLKTNSTICHVLTFSAWGTAVAWSAFPLFGYGSYNLEPHRTSCALDMGADSHLSMKYLVVLTALYYVFPVGLAALSAWMVSKQLSFHSFKKRGQNQDRKFLDSNRRTNELNIRILLTSFLTWLPLGIFAGISMWRGPPNINPAFYYIPQLSPKFGCALIPLAYRRIWHEVNRKNSAKPEKHAR